MKHTALFRAVLAASFALACVPACRSRSDAPDRAPADPAPVTGDVEVETPPAPAPTSGALSADLPPGAARPRFSPDGKRITFHAGAEGQRQVYVIDASGSGLLQLTSGPGDHRDPSFEPDGARIVYAADLDGPASAQGYDLHVVPVAGGAPERVTSMEGDELEPAIGYMRYGFYAVNTNHCSDTGVSARQLDGYWKVAFTRRGVAGAASEEVWFASVQPAGAAPIADADMTGHLERDDLSPHATHQGRVSAEGKRCRSPYWSGDGLSLVWLCDESSAAGTAGATPGAGAAVFDAEAGWDQSFEAALKAIGGARGKPCEYDWEDGTENGKTWRDSRCLDRLPRRYTRYDGKPISAPDPDLGAPTISANQIVLLAENDGRLMHRARGDAGAAWAPIEDIPAGAHHAEWSPDGTRIAYDVGPVDRSTLAVLATDFYLQSVRNLRMFPEWTGERSQHLADNHFVARPGKEKEFHVLYEKLRYQRRPQFVTADAALQVFRDEYQAILRQAETRGAEDLRLLSKAMMDAYTAAWQDSKSETDRWYAAYFATAWVPLEAMSQVPMPNMDELMYGDPDSKAEARKLQGPPIDRLSVALPAVYAALPAVDAALRPVVEMRVSAMLEHAGPGELAVPGRARPARIDWTQFRPRGAYAENELAAYFLAMSWYAAAPLPFDASLATLLERMEQARAGDATALELWKRVDTLVGAFMGRPVDVTPEHLQTTRSQDAAAFAAFDPTAMRKRLEKLRGPVPVRDLEAAEAGGGKDMALKVTLFPKRLGLDTTFFRALTHPDVPMRGMPSAVDVMAVLGAPRARVHALAQVSEDEAMAAAYGAALDKLVGAHAGGLAATDIYHAWLAVLVTLARSHDVPAHLLFAQNDAWRDRLLTSALGGYVQLKHSAVLYNVQDMSAECDSDLPIYVLVEQPLLPTPQGFVDPMPAFFDSLAALAERVYRELHGSPTGPEVQYWYEKSVADPDDEEAQAAPLNARKFARDLAWLARKEVDGKPLTEVEYRWIDRVGGRLEALYLGMEKAGHSVPTTPETRNQRGLAIVTDIHSNVTRQQALQIGIGRLLDLWVVVPGQVGQRMTQGGMFSFYEFAQPMSRRMTDAEWHRRLQAGKAPPLPAWTASFVASPP
jgi:hypothetical protein